VLVGWKVPISYDISFTSTTVINEHQVEADANFAKARFVAKMLSDRDNRFDGVLGPTIDTASNLLRWLTGQYREAFEKARNGVDSTLIASRSVLLEAGLTALIQADVQLAALCVAHIGTFDCVADELAKLLCGHFPQPHLLGAEIAKACS
jgi:hypothetical protein